MVTRKELDEHFATFSQPQQRPIYSAEEVRRLKDEDPNLFVDVFKGVLGGAERAVRSVVKLADPILPGPSDPWKAAGVKQFTPETETIVGGLVGGITQFAVGFGAVGAAGKGVLALSAKLGASPMNLSFLTAVPDKVAKLSAAGKTTQAMLLNAAYQGGIRGPIADFVAFAEDEERLSNLIQDSKYANSITELLAAEEDDSAFEGRLKNVAEGLILGGILEFGLDGLRRTIKRTKKIRAAIENGSTPEEAIQAAHAEIPEPVEPTREVIETREDGKIYSVPNQSVVEVEAISYDAMTNRTFRSTITVPADDPLLAVAQEQFAKAKKEWDALPEWQRTPNTEPSLGAIYRRLDLDRNEEPIKEAMRRIEETKEARIQEAMASPFDPKKSLVDPYEDVRAEVNRRQGVPTTPKRTAPPVAEEELTETAAKARRTEQVLREITEKLDELDNLDELEAFGRNLNERNAGEDLNYPYRKLPSGELARLDADRRFPNMEMFDGTDDSLIRLYRAVKEMGTIAAAKAKPTILEARAKAIAEIHKIIGGSQRDLARFIGRMQDHPDKIMKVGRDVQVAKFIASKASQEVTPVLNQVIADIERGIDVAPDVLRELIARTRQLPQLLEAVRETMSSVGYVLNQHKSVIGIDEVATDKTVFNWSHKDNVDTLMAAGVTAENRAKVLQVLKEIKTVMGSEDPLAAMKALKEYNEASAVGKGMMIAREFFMNAILSNPSSWVVNASGAPMMSLFRLFENMGGAKFVKAKAGFKASKIDPNFIGPTFAERHAITMKHADLLAAKEMEVFTKFYKSLGEALEIANKQGGAGYVQGGKMEKYHDFSAIRQAAAGKGRLAELAASVITFPSRAMTKSDEVIKIAAYRANAEVALYYKAIEAGLPPSARDAWVQKHLEILTKNRGDLRTSIAFDRILPDVIAEGVDDIAAEAGRRIDLQGKEIEDLLAIHDESIKFGETLTFSTRDGEGAFQRIGNYVSQIINDYPLVGFMVPFVRTPANIAQFTWDRSFGLVIEATVGKLNKYFQWSPEMKGNFLRLSRELNSPDVAVRASAMGRIMTGMVGLTTMGVLTSMTDDDGFPLVTGAAPEDKEERRALEQAGWQPYSIRVAGRYIQYSRLDPLAGFLGIAADYAQVMARMAMDPTKDELGLEAAAVAAVSAMAKNLTSKTYLQGLTNILEASSGDTSKIAAALGATAGGFVPSIVAGQVGAVDPYMREIRGVLDRIATRVPGLSATLAPRRNLLGEKVKRPSSTGFTALDAWLPTRVSQITDDIIGQEVAALKFGFNVPGLSVRGVDLTDPAYTVDGQDAYDRYTELSGQVKIGGRDLRQALRVLIQSPQYQALPPTMDEMGQHSPRVELINSTLSKYRKRAWTQLLQERPAIRQQVQTNQQASRRPRLF